MRQIKAEEREGWREDGCNNWIEVYSFPSTLEKNVTAFLHPCSLYIVIIICSLWLSDYSYFHSLTFINLHKWNYLPSSTAIPSIHCFHISLIYSRSCAFSHIHCHFLLLPASLPRNHICLLLFNVCGGWQRWWHPFLYFKEMLSSTLTNIFYF